MNAQQLQSIKLKDIKGLAKALNVKVTGDKRLKSVWIAAIVDFYNQKVAPAPADADFDAEFYASVKIKPPLTDEDETTFLLSFSEAFPIAA